MCGHYRPHAGSTSAVAGWLLGLWPIRRSLKLATPLSRHGVDSVLFGCRSGQAPRRYTFQPRIGSWTPACFLVYHRFKSTFCWLPNFAFSYLSSQRSRMSSSSLGHVRGWINCSEPVRQRSIAAFLEAFSPWGVTPLQCQASYGMAETVFAVTQTPPGEVPRGCPARCRPTLKRRPRSNTTCWMMFTYLVVKQSRVRKSDCGCPTQSRWRPAVWRN